MSNPISNLGTIPTMNLAGFTITDITNFKVLHSGANDGTNKRSTLRESGVGAGYVVPGGKTFRVIGFITWGDAANVTGLAYANTDIGQAVSTAFSTPIYQATGSSTFKGSTGNLAANANAVPFYTVPTKFDIPTGKYASIEFNTSGNCSATVFGYEF